MFPYRVKYTDSEYDIVQNTKIPKYVRILEINKKQAKQTVNFLFCNIYKLHD